MRPPASIEIFGHCNSMSIAEMEESMTQSFLDGMLVVLLPSMFVVAWLVWRAPVKD